jgi:predicted ATPase
MLEHVRFQNIRALADLTIDLSPLTVLVGPNACGKSTVLDEIDRLCAMSHPSPRSARSLRRPSEVLNKYGIPPITNRESGPQIWLGRGEDNTFDVTLREGTTPWHQRLLIHTSNPPNLFDQDSTQDGKIVQLDPALAAHYSWRAQRLSLERRHILAPSPVDAPLDRLDPSGAGLATLLLHLAANEPDAYRSLQQDLTAVVPDFQRLHVKPVPWEGETRYALELTFGGAGRIEARYTSEGTLFALGLLTAIHAPAMPEIVLLDDLDRGLHLTAQYQLIEAIRKVQQRQPTLQIVCTSHSPILVDSFAPAEVRVMALDPSGHAQARPLTEMPEYEAWSRSLQPGALWANFGESWVVDRAG